MVSVQAVLRGGVSGFGGELSKAIHGFKRRIERDERETRHEKEQMQKLTGHKRHLRKKTKSRITSLTDDAITDGTCQRRLKAVLRWLLSAEDQVDGQL